MIPLFGDLGTIFPATHLGDPHQIIAFHKSELPIHVDYQYQEIPDLVPQGKGKNALVLFDRGGDVSRWREACREVADEPAEGKIEKLQYLDDRIWAWCSYTKAKIERGKLWESRDAIEYIRTHVLVTLASITEGFPNEGNWQLEQKITAYVLRQLEQTLPISHSQAELPGDPSGFGVRVSGFVRHIAAKPASGSEACRPRLLRPILSFR